MDIRPLRYFLTIVDEGQITLAAKKLNIAQPPLSKYLKNLEDELGAKLIVRNGKKFELTESGLKLYKNGKEILHQLDQTILDISEIGHGLRGTLTIGISRTCASYLVNQMKQFNKLYPNVTFEILDGNPYHIENYLHKRFIELGIGKITDFENCSHIHLGTDPHVYLAPKSWSLKNGHSIGLKEISEHPFIALHRHKGEGSGIHNLIEKDFKKRNLDLNIVSKSRDANIILLLVEAGIGATILPKSFMNLHPGIDVGVYDIQDFDINTDVCLFWLKGSYISKAAEHFIKMIETDNYFSFDLNNKDLLV